MTLYELTHEGLAIQDLLAENYGELTPEMETRLDEMLKGGKGKLDAAAAVVRGLSASAEACSTESNRLGQRSAQFKAQAERLKARMAVAVDAAFGGKLTTDRFTIWNQTTPGTLAIEVRDGQLDDLEFSFPETVKVERTIRKTVVKEMLERGEDLSAFLNITPVEGVRGVRIR